MFPEELKLTSAEISDVEKIIDNPETTVVVEKLTGKGLAQAFIQSRLENAKDLEGAKSKALNILLTKIDSNSRPELLMKVIELLDNCTSKDMDSLIALGQNNKTSDLLSDSSDKSSVKGTDSITADSSLKMLHNVLTAVKGLHNSKSST